MAWWRPTDEATTSAVGLIIAAATFGVAFTAAQVMVEKPAGVDPLGGQLDRTAATALDVIISHPGRATTGGAWTADADLIDRFGLARDGEENFLDYVKIKSMRNGSMHHTENNAPDYDDVRTALGIDDRDFHLRTYPVIPGLDDPRWTKEPRGRYAYIAHGVPSTTPPDVHVDTVVGIVGDELNVSVTIRNDEASGDYLFSATIGLGKMSSDTTFVDLERHTRPLAPGASQTVWASFPRMDYTGAPDGVRVTIADAQGRVIEDPDRPAWTAATVPTGSTYSVGVKVSAGQRYYLTTEELAFRVNRYDAAGDIPNEAVNWVFVLVDPAGTEIYNNTLELKKKKSASYECTVCTTPGLYTGFFYNTPKSPFAPTLRDMDVVQVVTTAPSAGPIDLAPIAETEIDIISDLVVGFDPDPIYDAVTNPQGDVFDDASKVRSLPSVLERYSTLVVGSEVEQNALNSADIKWAIADWVIKGGNLIVLGRTDGHANWLQPVYKASIAGAGGGIGVPDPTHPVLTSPNRLDYEAYNDNGLSWGIRQDQPFTHVLTRGVTGTERQDTLAIANPGAYNDGTVILTSYIPGALTTPQDDAEAKKFLHNLFSQSYNMLFLDYGPPIPEKTPVGSAQRLVAVPHPNVPGAVVEVRIVMYAWT